MRKVTLMLAFVSFLLLAANARAIDICDVNHLPLYASANSSMLFMVPESVVLTTLSNLSEPMKITYWVADSNFNVVDEGSLMKFADCWLCEFSGKVSDFYGNCGPTPFRKSDQFVVYFTAKDFTQQIEFNRTVLVNPEGLDIGVNVDDSGTVKIRVEAPIDTNEVWMSLYDAVDGKLIQDFDRTQLTAGEYTGTYYMDITSLSLGSYYASFGFRAPSGKSGGGVSKFDIGQKEIELTVQTDSSSYWLGEEAVISGQTKYSQVTASVKLPDSRTVSLGSQSVSNGQFSYTFKLLNTYGDGNYVVTVSSGTASKQRSFSVDKYLYISPPSLTFSVTNRTGSLSQSVTIQNVANETVSLSASTQDVTSYVTTSFDKTTIAPTSTSTLTVTVNPATISTDLTGQVLVKGNNVVTIPVDVTINLDLPGAPGDERMDVSPGFWRTEDCMVGEDISTTFDVQNSGKGELSGFGYTMSTGLDGISTVTLPSSSVPEGSFGSVALDITPDEKSTSGWMRITSNGGQETIDISLDCAEDLDYDLTTLQSDVDTLKSQFYDAGYDDDAVSSIFYMLDLEVGDALTDLSAEEYASSKASYATARARYDTLGNLITEMGPGPVQPIDYSWVIWVVVIVILGVVGYFVYTKYGDKLFGQKGAEEEEAYEEELY